jgi:hypothetical protein
VVPNQQANMSHILIRSRWCDIIVLNIHAPTDDKIDDTNDRFYEELERVFEKISKDKIKSMFGDFNAKIDREGIFTPTIRNESLHKITCSNYKGARVVAFAAFKNFIVKSTMFPHHNIHMFAWTSSD